MLTIYSFSRVYGKVLLHFTVLQTFSAGFEHMILFYDHFFMFKIAVGLFVRLHYLAKMLWLYINIAAK